jgi:hypothetical protein
MLFVPQSMMGNISKEEWHHSAVYQRPLSPRLKMSYMSTNVFLSNKEVKRLQKIEHKELGTTGVGCRTIEDTYDRFILYALYLEQPYRSLGSYQDWLCYFTGSNPSRSTISRYLKLKTAYPHSAGFVKPNMVPYDKFRQENIEKAYDYIFTILQFSPVTDWSSLL